MIVGSKTNEMVEKTETWKFHLQEPPCYGREISFNCRLVMHVCARID